MNSGALSSTRRNRTTDLHAASRSRLPASESPRSSRICRGRVTGLGNSHTQRNAGSLASTSARSARKVSSLSCNPSGGTRQASWQIDPGPLLERCRTSTTTVCRSCSPTMKWRYAEDQLGGLQTCSRKFPEPPVRTSSHPNGTMSLPSQSQGCDGSEKGMIALLWVIRRVCGIRSQGTRTGNWKFDSISHRLSDVGTAASGRMSKTIQFDAGAPHVSLDPNLEPGGRENSRLTLLSASERSSHNLTDRSFQWIRSPVSRPPLKRAWGVGTRPRVEQA